MITSEQVKSALIDKTDGSWNTLVSNNRDEIIPTLLGIIRENYKRNKVPSATIESVIAHVTEGIRLEDVALLTRLRTRE